MTCYVEGCEKQDKHLGLCNAHYKRKWRHGDPLMGRTQNGRPAEFIKQVLDTNSDECIVWPFSKRKGYGAVYYNGKNSDAHRVVLFECVGEPPTKSHEAAHSCGNKECVNWKHLRWATHVENIGDKVVHGTTNRGERSATAKLSEAQVLEIREMLSSNMKRKAEIARQYGVTFMAITNIQRRKTWAHI